MPILTSGTTQASHIVAPYIHPQSRHSIPPEEPHSPHSHHPIYQNRTINHDSHLNSRGLVAHRRPQNTLNGPKTPHLEVEPASCSRSITKQARQLRPEWLPQAKRMHLSPPHRCSDILDGGGWCFETQLGLKGAGWEGLAGDVYARRVVGAFNEPEQWVVCGVGFGFLRELEIEQDWYIDAR